MGTQEWYSVEQVADLLGLHVRTVRGYVRSGRLPATRIGKQYRVTRADLDALTGRPAPAAPATVRSEASSVVHIDGLGAAAVERVRTALLAAVGGRGGGDAPLHVQCLHDPARDRMTVLVLGGPAVSAEVLRLVAALVEGVR